MKTNKNEKPIYDTIETINHNNKPTEISNENDTGINDLTYKEKFLGNGSDGNHQTRIENNL